MKLFLLFSLLPLVVDAQHSASWDDLGNQSQIQIPYPAEIWDPDVGQFDWNITIEEYLTVQTNDTYYGQGIFPVTTTYKLDGRSFDVEFFKVDCKTAPSGPEQFPLEYWTFYGEGGYYDDWAEGLEDSEIRVEIGWLYNQTKMEQSDLWTSTKTGGYSEFCIRLNTYLGNYTGDDDYYGVEDPFATEVHFLEVKYRIDVDSLTDFEGEFNISRIGAIDGGVDTIDYEEDINVFQCDDSFNEIVSPPALTQGDYLQLCVQTESGSKFGVHSIKELDVTQDGSKLYPYVDGYIDSPLTATACQDSNQTIAICSAKMQLIASYFDDMDPSDLDINGIVKLDYVGRRLSVDVPVSLKLGESKKGRMLEVNKEQSSGFEISVELASATDSAVESGASLSSMMGSVLAATMTLLAVVGFM